MRTGRRCKRCSCAAWAPPRPLASVPCAETRAVCLLSSMSSNFTVPAKVKDALKRLADQKADLSATQRQIEEIYKQLKEIADE